MTHVLYPLVQPLRTTEFGFDVARSVYSEFTAFNKFGKNPSVGTTVAPIATAGVYQTPAALTSLEIVSSSADDTSAGTGARTVYIEGIGTDWAVVSETVSMNGITAVALANQYWRIYRWYVATSGTYASSSASSHAGTLTLRVAAAGATWDTIGLVDSLGKGQSKIACYSVPAGKTLYVTSLDFSIESTKVVNLYMFKRENADDVSSPYSPMRLQREYDGLVAAVHVPLWPPLKFDAKTDLVFMGEVSSGTASVSCQFDGILVNA